MGFYFCDYCIDMKYVFFFKLILNCNFLCGWEIQIYNELEGQYLEGGIGRWFRIVCLFLFVSIEDLVVMDRVGMKGMIIEVLENDICFMQ